MITLFRYNWQVRDDWFDWCEQVSNEELLRNRTGGVGSILETLYHIIVMEWGWIRGLQGKTYSYESFDKYQTLDQVRQLSAKLHPEVKAFLELWTDEQESNILRVPSKNGLVEEFTFGEALRHVIAHEIHHVGQLSIWSRELDLEPITANLIRRGLVNHK